MDMEDQNYLFLNISFANTSVMEDLLGKTGTLPGKVTENLGEVKFKKDVFAHLELFVI